MNPTAKGHERVMDGKLCSCRLLLVAGMPWYAFLHLAAASVTSEGQTLADLRNNMYLLVRLDTKMKQKVLMVAELSP